MINGPSVVVDDAAGEEVDNGDGGCTDGVGDEDACAGREDASGDDGSAGTCGAGGEGIGGMADDCDDCGGSTAGDDG